MSTGPDLFPESSADVVDAVADALRANTRLECRGGGTKTTIGAPRAARILDMSRQSGVVDYDPAELVLTARAGTPLAEVEALVASESQMLAFDPFDYGPILGAAAGSTIGGVIAAGVAGSRRISAGGARDHLLGFEAVSGRGERFVAGAKVVKNVTGYDLPKLAAGSWGRLFVLTEVTLKVLPASLDQATIALSGLPADVARRAMAAAMGSQAEVQAAAHIPGGHAGEAVTVVRLEGFGPSVTARTAMIEGLWAAYGAPRVLDTAEAQAYWREIRTLAPVSDGRPLWRVNSAPSAGPKIVADLAPLGARWLFDWAGGLTWLTLDGHAEAVRAAAEAAGGHAMLVRAPEEVRRTVPAFHPPAPGVAALETRVRRAFDPGGVFATGRFMEDDHAD